MAEREAMRLVALMVGSPPCPAVQHRVRASPGAPRILARTAVDERLPQMRELALRALVDGREANVAAVAEIEREAPPLVFSQTVSTTHTLDRAPPPCLRADFPRARTYKMMLSHAARISRRLLLVPLDEVVDHARPRAAAALLVVREVGGDHAARRQHREAAELVPKVL